MIDNNKACILEIYCMIIIEKFKNVRVKHVKKHELDN